MTSAWAANGPSRQRGASTITVGRPRRRARSAACSAWGNAIASRGIVRGTAAAATSVSASTRSRQRATWWRRSSTGSPASAR
ncbi:MAG: hypothetical protein KA201_25890 [Kofleriaceae bacterium]|nr:hypothetical protein [Kofleriaceae bacterium]